MHLSAQSNAGIIPLKFALELYKSWRTRRNMGVATNPYYLENAMILRNLCRVLFLPCNAIFLTLTLGFATLPLCADEPKKNDVQVDHSTNDPGFFFQVASAKDCA